MQKDHLFLSETLTLSPLATIECPPRHISHVTLPHMSPYCLISAMLQYHTCHTFVSYHPYKTTTHVTLLQNDHLFHLSETLTLSTSATIERSPRHISHVALPHMSTHRILSAMLHYHTCHTTASYQPCYTTTHVTLLSHIRHVTLPNISH